MADINVEAIGNSITSIINDKNQGSYRWAREYIPITPSSETVTVINTITLDAQITYFKRGYYIAGATFEYWKSTNPLATNPSGNPLIDIVVLSMVPSS